MTSERRRLEAAAWKPALQGPSCIAVPWPVSSPHSAARTAFSFCTKRVAEVERLLAAQRTRFAMRALKLKGKTFGTVPFGYRRNADGGLDPQPGEIEIVREIIAMRAKGAKLVDIAAHLTASTVATRRGGKWSAEQVRSILERAKTQGLPERAASAA